eukprot:TRINITY_DN14937_c0_g5_i1.p1 TRINITY_DN14937_c0_g5~~TRINITY_DN14937_c0_g5_i1.p1  ORF type:complete len:441 (-),score=51.27 TRINITY_DN14937_c0_g5_i1:210-1532(-)
MSESWSKRVQELTTSYEKQEKHNRQRDMLRNKHRRILRTQGRAAAARHARAYEESDSHLFADLHSGVYEAEVMINTDLTFRICKGFEHVSSALEHVTAFSRQRRAPLEIAARLGRLLLFANSFSSTNPSATSLVDWQQFRGTIMEWFYRPHLAALNETACHLEHLIERLHLGAVMQTVLGNDARQKLHVRPDVQLQIEHIGRAPNARAEEVATPSVGSSACTSAVFQEIAHAEPAAVIDREVAALQVQAEADDQFAQLVERRLEISELQGSPSEKVHLISFRSGKGELFRKMLLQDKEFKPLRTSLQEASCPLEIRPQGTIVLVKPTQYFEVVSALGRRKLKRYQLLITESVEYLMDQVLARMASKSRPREKVDEREEIDVRVCGFVCKRSFICEAPRLLMSGAVSQSTTEALRSGSSASQSYFAQARGINPRRYVLGPW